MRKLEMLDGIIAELQRSPNAEEQTIGELLASVRTGGGGFPEITSTLDDLIAVARSIRREIGASKRGGAGVNYEVFVEAPASIDETGEVSISTGEHFYAASAFGTTKAIGDYLREQGFGGLGRYVRSLRKRMVAYLSGMEVPAELRRRGYGSMLVYSLLREFERLNIQTVVLHASPSRGISMDSLAAFYKRFGFRDVDCCAEDVWPVMRLDLK